MKHLFGSSLTFTMYMQIDFVPQSVDHGVILESLGCSSNVMQVSEPQKQIYKMINEDRA